MPESVEQAGARFRALFDETTRAALLESELKQAILEFACPSCGRGILRLPPGLLGASLECPACDRRCWMERDGSRMSLVSEERIQRIVTHLRRKNWYCSDHEGTRVELVALEQDPGRPLEATLRFICRRRNAWRRLRAHETTRRISLLAWEAEAVTASPQGQDTARA